MLFGFCFRFFRIFAQIATVKKFVFKSREKKIQIFLSKNACKTAKKNADKNEICLIELEINTFWFLFHTKIGKLGKFLFFFFLAIELLYNWERTELKSIPNTSKAKRQVTLRSRKKTFRSDWISGWERKNVTKYEQNIPTTYSGCVYV